MSCFREQKKDRKQHGENCYRRALKVVREMSHPSWKPVELNTIHEFARELLGAGMQKQAVKEMHGAMEMLVRSTPTRPCSPAQLDFQDVSDSTATRIRTGCPRSRSMPTPVSLSSLLCIYMPAVDRSLSL